MREAYEIYFQIKVENREKYWIPNTCCSTCAISLRSVYRGGFDHLFRFTSPISWREPQNHIDDCYFCLTDVKGYPSKWKDSLIYPNVSSVTKAAYNLKDSISGNFTKRFAEETNYSNENQTMEHKPTRNLPQLFDQKGLDDLIRHLKLSKNKAEILGSKLKERNFLEKDLKIPLYRNREIDFTTYFLAKIPSFIVTM